MCDSCLQIRAWIQHLVIVLFVAGIFYYQRLHVCRHKPLLESIDYSERKRRSRPVTYQDPDQISYVCLLSTMQHVKNVLLYNHVHVLVFFIALTADRAQFWRP